MYGFDATHCKILIKPNVKLLDQMHKSIFFETFFHRKISQNIVLIKFHIHITIASLRNILGMLNKFGIGYAY